jgi:hypothetical protein
MSLLFFVRARESVFVMAWPQTTAAILAPPAKDVPMKRNKDLQVLAEAIGESLALGMPPANARDLARHLAKQAFAATLVDALFAEALAKRPKNYRIDGYLYLLGEALDELRLRGNGGDVVARREAEAVVDAVGVRAESAKARPDLLLALARALKQAGFEPPAALQAVMGAAMTAHTSPPGASRANSRKRAPHQAATPQANPPQVNPRQAEAAIRAQLAEMAKECGDDPFSLHQELAALLSAFPLDIQAVMVEAFIAHPMPAVRHAGLGFVLSPSVALARAALDACARAVDRAGGDPLMVDRLATMRPWAMQALRPAADKVLKRAQSLLASDPPPSKQGTLFPDDDAPRAARKPSPQKTAAGASAAPALECCLATVCDGAGGQSLLGVMRHKRHWILAALLIKADAGVTDAWVARDMTKGDVDSAMAQLALGGSAHSISLDVLKRRLEDGLARNAQAAPPPFGLVEVCEVLRLKGVTAHRTDPVALLGDLLEDAPAADTAAAAIERALEDSRRWAEHHMTMDSWFEAGEDVQALLQPIRGRAKRELVALALAKARDVADVPLMQAIAIDTVRAFEG